jgi:hypothetical protein
VNTFLQKLPRIFLAGLESALFKALIDKALEYKLITLDIKINIDFHEIDYYGVDRNPANSGITNVNDGAGTNRAQKYCELMISSGCGVLFAGVNLNRQSWMIESWIFQQLMLLLSWGFSIKRVIADREFTTYNMLAVLGFLDIPYTGPIKRIPAIRKLIDQFINAKSPAVILFDLQPSAKTRFKVGAPLACL